MDDWTIANTWGVLDRFAEEKANAEFISACKNGDLSKIEFELQHGRDPNLAILKKSPLWYAKNNPEAIKLLLEYGAAPELYEFYHFCRRFFKDELLELCKLYLINADGRDIFKRLQNGKRELEKRYDVCRQAGYKTIMEYNRNADLQFKKYFMVFPFIHILHDEELKLLVDIANKGRAADIHVAIGSVDDELPVELAMSCQEKISAPLGANTLQDWYCSSYSVNSFSRM
ncbi:MAG: hypothetical protein E7042_01710 [Lentisphaerae bacterium]|nr:hypothetical protein [Lentisphaerota bacterium]